MRRRDLLRRTVAAGLGASAARLLGGSALLRLYRHHHGTKHKGDGHSPEIRQCHLIRSSSIVPMRAISIR